MMLAKMGALRQTRPACFVRRTRRAVSAPDDWHEYNPDLRTEQNGKAVQDALDYFSFKCGLGTRRYRFEASGVKTATEYTGDRQDMVQHANRHQIGANGDRVLRTKQGAVSGAALRFSQGRKSRSENRLSARGRQPCWASSGRCCGPGGTCWGRTSTPAPPSPSISTTATSPTARPAGPR